MVTGPKMTEIHITVMMVFIDLLLRYAESLIYFTPVVYRGVKYSGDMEIHRFTSLY